MDFEWPESLQLVPRRVLDGTICSHSGYTAEPIYSYMIDKNAGPNQMLISTNDRL